MILISKLFNAVFLPPGCIITALFIMLFFIPRKFKVILGLVFLIFYSLSIQPVSDFLIRGLEDKYAPLTGDSITLEPDAIAVLGGGIVQGSPEEARDSLAPNTLKRLVYAFSLRNDYPYPFVLCGGKVFDHDQEPESEIAERVLLSMGFPPERIVTESESRNTWENAARTAELGYKTIILVTSAYHMPRSVLSFTRKGMAVIPAPTDYKSDRGREYDFISFLPSMEYLRVSYLALHEYVGFVFYSVFNR
jgi:uncharacterized SAM-binding protein YcdF (DUF218 family)